MFNPIIRYLPGYFDTDPDLAPAIRARSPGRHLTWRVNRNTLTLDVDGAPFVYDLTGHSVSSLISALRADGLDVTWENSDLIALGAANLWSGEGAEDADYGATLKARRSHLYALTLPVEEQWHAFNDGLPLALAQIPLLTATDWWLNRHGALYGIPRPTGASDTDYRAHIFEEIRRPRNNPRGIEYSARRLLPGQDVRICEPWQYLLRTSVSALSTDQRFPDGVLWTKSVMRVTSPDPIDWAQAQGIAQSDRPAGTLLLDPVWAPLARHADASLSGLDDPLMSHTLACLYMPGIWHPIWDISRLSDYAVTRNYRMAQTVWNSILSVPDIGAAHLDQPRTVCRGDIALSEDSALGDANTRYPARYFVEAPGASRRASDDLALSDYDAQRAVVVIRAFSESPVFPGGNAVNKLVEDFSVRNGFNALHRITAPPANAVGKRPAWLEGGWDGRSWMQVNPIKITMTVERSAAPGNKTLHLQGEAGVTRLSLGATETD
jgi:hypothetical protein